MKNFIVPILVFLLTLGLFSTFDTPDIQPTYSFSEIKINPEKRNKPAENETIAKINERNDKIKSIYYENVDVELYQGIKINLKSSLAYKKDKNFRMSHFSKIGGKEVELGSNPEGFWFWSKRLTPQYIYYSTYDKISQTRLKTPFHPLWIMESLSINKIDPENVLFGEFQNKILIIEPRVATNGVLVEKITLINKSNLTIIGHYLYDGNSRCIASSEIEEFQTVDGHFCPKVLKIIWYEEGIIMRWNMNTPVINSEIDPKLWAVPNLEKIDLSF